MRVCLTNVGHLREHMFPYMIISYYSMPEIVNNTMLYENCGYYSLNYNKDTWLFKSTKFLAKTPYRLRLEIK